MSNENVEINVFDSGAGYAAESQDEQRVAEVIRSRVLPDSDDEYYQANVRIRRSTGGSPDHLVVHLLRKDIYLTETVRVDVGDGYEVNQITWSYDESQEDEDEDQDGDGGGIPYQGGNEKYDFVVATPVPQIKTAKKLVDDLHKLFTGKNYTCKQLVGPEATVANYKYYLTSGLKGFVNVGHGNPYGIFLHGDAPLSHKWFNGLPSGALKKVVFFNSCQVCKQPMLDAVAKAGARPYVGGYGNLAIGPSEKVTYCFWEKVMQPPGMDTNGMGRALLSCCKQYENEDPGSFVLYDLFNGGERRAPLPQAMTLT
ncbi:hypothetical protein ALI144C_06785 [Actinosynnema sp. ALI-1.44]|uniref:hypothetical protein n=1 Tax=Actinosynnema sp. ALI-1.44 TaxID=1933779 RepID=UPI00097C88DA|nr:hypothetical protein [Actinosynnema sp. ALI-1.44]ONI88167.1 hypothetical protein ALI144C_06785 [Actinosynnema sp. ALI-1.44]